MSPEQLDVYEAWLRDDMLGGGFLPPNARSDALALVDRVRELERLIDPLGHGKRVCNRCKGECVGPVVECLTFDKGVVKTLGPRCMMCAYNEADKERDKFKEALEEIAGDEGRLRCGQKPFKDGSCSSACVACELAQVARKALA